VEEKMSKNRRRNRRRNGRGNGQQKQRYSRKDSYGVPRTTGVFEQPEPENAIIGTGPDIPPKIEDRMTQLPPGRGKRFIEHISTFQTRLQSFWSKIYVNSDEAYRESRENATAMRRDPVIMQPLRERQLATALLEHHVLPEDDRDPVQKKVASELQQIINETPHFTKFKQVLLEAIWYGKYGINVVYNWDASSKTQLDGSALIDLTMVPVDWIPVHGEINQC